MQVSHTKHTHSCEKKASSYFNTTRQHLCLRHAWGAANQIPKTVTGGRKKKKVFQCPKGEWQSSKCENRISCISWPERVWELVNSPDTASWNSSSLRALRGEDPLTTDCSSSWCSVARVCSASERILFFSTSCSNFRLRTWARHTQTHKHTHRDSRLITHRNIW